jgi:predicted AAA+ superfamily ATPase
MYPRHVRPTVAGALIDTPAVMVVGARQVGKSTLVRTIRPEPYVTLDTATTRAGATTDPDGFVAGLPSPVALDEVQRVPELFLAIKAAIDARRTPGQFLLTGSADALALPRVADALPGRMEVIELWPLSQGEIEGQVDGFVDAVFAEDLKQLGSPATDRSALLDRILRGGFPEVVARSPQRRAAWHDAYLTALVDREVRDVAEIGNVAELTFMVRLIAARTGALFNLADVARGAGLSHSTARRYLGILRAVFLVVELPSWSTSLTTRLVKAPKMMLADSGLAAHVLGVDRARLEADPQLLGGLLEGFVAMELRKQLTWSARTLRLSHFRHRQGHEVDLVLEDRGGEIVGVEVKASATVTSSDFRGLRLLADVAGPRFRRGVVLYAGADTVGFGERLMALPLTALWTANRERPV